MPEHPMITHVLVGFMWLCMLSMFFISIYGIVKDAKRDKHGIMIDNTEDYND